MGAAKSKDAKIGLQAEAPQPQVAPETPEQIEQAANVRTPPKTPAHADAPASRGSSSKKKKALKLKVDSDESSSSESSSDYSSSDSSSSSEDEHRHSHKKKRRKKKKKGHKHHKHHKHHEEEPPPVDEEDRALLELLQEYLSFYGTGDEYSDQIVKDTLDQLGPDALDLKDEYGNSVMLLVVQYGHSALLPPLLAKGVDVNARNKEGACALHFVCYTDSFDPESAQLLVDNGAHPEVVEKTYGCTPLHWAASAADVSLCRLLCNAGCSPSTLDNHGCDPAAYAAQVENGAECVEFLEKVGARTREGRAAERAKRVHKEGVPFCGGSRRASVKEGTFVLQRKQARPSETALEGCRG
jgi:ankyrin repeat protein